MIIVIVKTYEMIFIDWHCAHVKIPRDKILEIKKKNIIPTKHDKLVKIGLYLGNNESIIIYTETLNYVIFSDNADYIFEKLKI